MPGDDSPDVALRIAALLGVTEGPGNLLLTGSSALQAAQVAALVPGVEILAAHAQARGEPEREDVSRMWIDSPFPFQSGVLRGVVLEGPSGVDLLSEGIRVMARGARLVFLDPPPGTVEAMAEAGLEILLSDDVAGVGTLK